MVLLDATADLDGYQAMNLSWRVMPDMPQASYANLRVISEPSIGKNVKLKNYLVNATNIGGYVAWMHDTIKKHSTAGEDVLIVCKKVLLQHGHVDEAFDLDGRHVKATHWGDGIGYNSWKSATTVLLFDEFFIPRGQVIAMANGLHRAKATDGPAGGMGSMTASHPEVDALWTGHLLRWMKQMALRGHARAFDAQGVCGKMTLVFCGTKSGRDRLLANYV